MNEDINRFVFEQLYEGPIDQAIGTRAQEMAENLPWLNGSRKRLLMIWLPINLVFISIVGYTGFLLK